MKLDRFRSFVALALVSALTGSLVPLPVLAQEAPAELAGRVTTADRITGIPGSVVVLIGEESHDEHRSEPVTKDGAFRMQVPAGRYVVVVETPDGAFLAAESLTLVAGEHRLVSLALDPSLRSAVSGGLGQSSGGFPTWAKWLIVGGIVVGAAVAIDSVTEDNEPPASPF